MTWIYHNGEFKSRDTIHVDIEDRGYQFGDGIYEVFRIYDQQLFEVDAHLQRLERSANEIKMHLPVSRDTLARDMHELVQRNDILNGIVYLQVTRGVAARYHGFPSSDVPTQMVAYVKNMPRPTEDMQQGVNAILIDDSRWLRCDIKSLNLLGNVLAKQTASEHGAFEAIQHRDGTVTEGSSSNVFMIQNGKVYTHPATNLILNGITRLKVLKLCQQLQLEVYEKSFSTEEILDADEVFITSTTSEIMPIKRVNDQDIGPGIPGPLTVKLQEAFEKEIQAV
ncbi:D-amino-acid transaminase [Caldalkalibacillus salinus]|uniref:D-amino-acid transaminase n=1 Tax=Caldalkalibacillus salinus TaxID=2803787 RepID=UPI0019224F3B|nr:D-amino-acid transaminase [Caldalkalibacillus salinus]